jgi:hypothetical protein
MSFRQFSQKWSVIRRMKWIWIGLGAALAVRFYYVREMIAALILFSILFLAVAAVALIFFLLSRASERITTWAEAGVVRALQWVVHAVEIMIAKPVWAPVAPHRFRKELKESEKN